MKDFKSSAARLARFFQDSRDKWKARAAEVQKRWRAAQVRIRDLENSRAYWKARALAAEQEQATRVCTDKPREGEDTPSAPLLATPVANHHYSLEVMELCLQMYLHTSIGCRGVSWVMQLFGNHLPVGVPAYTTVLNWVYRLGLAVLQHPLPRRDDWIFILDNTIALGELKCLVVLGIPASRLAETGYSPSHRDMTVLAVEITANSTGVWVEAVLRHVAARTGEPVQIVSDHGSDLRKGIALYRQQAPSCVETYDISHAIATALKAHWREDSTWQAFLKQASATLSRFQQTDLAFLLPPSLRTKARYMAIEAHIDWVLRVLAYYDRGDFSAIGRPTVFSAMAWKSLRKGWTNSAVAPLRALIGTPYPSRAALCEALREQVASADVTALEEHLDDAFWRLADRGYGRFLEAFEWVLAYRDSVPEWTQTSAVSKTIQTVVKTKGLARTTADAVKAALAELGPLSPPVEAFQTQMLTHLQGEAAKLPEGATWLGSSDIIESVFGHYKAFTARGPLKEIGKLVLTIPAFLSDLTAPVIRNAMESVRTIDVEHWVETHLGDSMLKRRRQALIPT
ncbi:hypothetical protein Thiowin_00232 [Thiorhodovibrio winogradskyi]|uniref:Transposase n=1 Tax=Thiorhodovibrio winogradskyi TaxID=77007 RepID=A0ABZ0S555_9GAMM|nr:hypothetical protein [Thiorhodovibrio winogradskyi]